MLEAIPGKFQIINVRILITTIGLQHFFVVRQHIRSDDVRLAIIVIVGYIISHAKPAVMAKMAGPTFGKGPITIIYIVIVIFMKIVSYIYIIPPVVIEISNTNSQSIAEVALVNPNLG